MYLENAKSMLIMDGICLIIHNLDLIHHAFINSEIPYPRMNIQFQRSQPCKALFIRDENTSNIMVMQLDTKMSFINGKIGNDTEIGHENVDVTKSYRLAISVYFNIVIINWARHYSHW